MYSRGLHIIALLTAIATFPLIFMGGLVTSHQAGMSVPDWPNSWGYNMFLFPPRLWRGGIFYEHTHRLMATVVGMLSIVLATYASHAQIANAATRFGKIVTRGWIRGTTIPSAFPRKVRWVCLSVLGAVIFQGVLGGLRVVLVKLDLAIVHACVAQAFFCFATFATLITSRWWIEAPAPTESSRGLIAACLFAVVAIYLQLIVGATMRHYEAGLAVPDLPLAYGQIIPSTDAASMHRINQIRIWKIDLPTVTAGQIWLHIGHRIGAVVVSIAVSTAAGIVVLKHRDQTKLLVPALGMLVLLVAQISLGAATVLYRKPADVASAHVAVGALTLVTAFVLLARASRVFATPRAAIVRRERFDEIPEGAVIA